MSTTKPQRSFDEVAQLGRVMFDERVRPSLRPEDDGKFVAIDVQSGDYELNVDDYAAVMRLRSRKPAAATWLMRVGSPTTCRIGAIR